MKILVMCPGSFVHNNIVTGLNSPERGEGRWAQNYAHMLALDGHDVYAASGGLPQPIIESGVKLIDQNKCKDYEPYDLLIDAAWWDNKVPAAKARKYIALKWALEGYLTEKPFPEDFYLGYVYPCHNWKFNQSDYINRDKTFAMPTMFGQEFEYPRWDNERIFLPGKVDLNRPWQKYKTVITEILDKYPVVGATKQFFNEHFGNSHPDSIWFDNISYDKVLELMRSSKINFPILSPGCVIEATFQGLPSIHWRQGEFFPALSDGMNVTIEDTDNPQVVSEKINELMNNKKRYMEVLRYSQDFFSPHLFENAVQYFDIVTETIFS